MSACLTKPGKNPNVVVPVLEKLIKKIYFWSGKKAALIHSLLNGKIILCLHAI